jgi:hypothetical protein
MASMKNQIPIVVDNVIRDVSEECKIKENYKNYKVPVILDGKIVHTVKYQNSEDIICSIKGLMDNNNFIDKKGKWINDLYFVLTDAQYNILFEISWDRGTLLSSEYIPGDAECLYMMHQFEYINVTENSDVEDDLYVKRRKDCIIKFNKME